MILETKRRSLRGAYNPYRYIMRDTIRKTNIRPTDVLSVVWCGKLYVFRGDCVYISYQKQLT